MSNYNLAINWANKDNLSPTDTDKIISGADFNTEFNAVKTAVNTKAELNGSASESFEATTAVAGANTTQVATTAFVQGELSNYSTTTEMNTADSDHAALRSSSTVFGHAKIWVSGTTLNIETS